jgi:pyruvate dehydrogenase E1 component alpha subunit
MEYTPIGEVTAVANPAAGRAPAYGIPAEIIDGNDVVVVKDVVAAAAERARAADGPTVIEALTYRHFGHSRTDPGPTGFRRGRGLAARDPLELARARLQALGMPAESVAMADERAGEAVAEAVAAAKAAPGPDPDDALTDVWADGGSAWRT